MNPRRDSDSEQPLVTMALLTYNSAKTVLASLESLRAQDYPALEILVVDDASKDDSVEICRRVAAQDSRIRIERNPKNLGQWGNFARSAELARGRYICWACPGDWWDPRYTSALVKRLLQVPGAVAAQSDVLRINEKTREPVELHVMRGSEIPDQMRAHERTWATLVKTRAGEVRPRYSYYLNGLVSTEAVHKTFRAFAFEDPIMILNERVAVAHWAITGPLVTVPETLIQREWHELPAIVRWPNDPWLQRRNILPFGLLTVCRQFLRSVWRSELLSPRQRVMMMIIVAEYLLRETWEMILVKVVPWIRRLLPMPIYHAARRWYRRSGTRATGAE